MVSKTRKLKKASEKALTIPQLRKAFEHIDRFVESKVLRLSEKEGISEFRKEWKRTFGEISEESARDYLQYMRTRSSKSKIHKQSGGAVTVLSPASLGYDMRGGESDAALSYPAYVSSGFLAPPMDSVAATCGKPDAFLPPAADTGSNAWTPMAGGGRSRSRSRKSKTRKAKKQAGGGIGTSFSEFIARPFGMGSPPTMSQDFGKILTGYNGFPSPRPEINNLPFTQPTTIFNASISPTTRLL